jgi:hypothetical protein
MSRELTRITDDDVLEHVATGRYSERHALALGFRKFFKSTRLKQLREYGAIYEKSLSAFADSLYDYDIPFSRITEGLDRIRIARHTARCNALSGGIPKGNLTEARQRQLERTFAMHILREIHVAARKVGCKPPALTIMVGLKQDGPRGSRVNIAYTTKYHLMLIVSDFFVSTTNLHRWRGRISLVPVMSQFDVPVVLSHYETKRSNGEKALGFYLNVPYRHMDHRGALTYSYSNAIGQIGDVVDVLVTDIRTRKPIVTAMMSEHKMSLETERIRTIFTNYKEEK